MAYKTVPTNNYIKCVRGTKEQYQQLIVNDDTLYFVYDINDSTIGELYLGNKLIGDGKGATSLSELVSNIVADGDLLIYDEATESWISTSVDNAIRTMSGATATQDGQSGLVPVPKKGDQTKFLRGDGQWTEVPSIAINIEELINNKADKSDFEALSNVINKIDLRLTWQEIVED